MKNKKLNGHIYVSAYDTELTHKFNAEIDRLRNFGRNISEYDAQEPSDDVVILSHKQFDAQNSASLAFIIICEDENLAKQYNAILPDGFAILSALGGGEIEQGLVNSIDTEIEIDKIMVGFNWTMVTAGDYCGIARSPSRGTEGARTVRPEGGFAGRSLKSIAQMLYSTDALSRSVGLAAINAFCNQPDSDKQAKSSMASGFSSIEAPGEGVVIIGGFRGVTKRLTAAKIVEREPRAEDVPIEQAADTIASAKTLAITAQTLMNGSLEPLLLASQKVKRRMLIGPSTPLSSTLFNHGLTDLSGMAVYDREAIERFICETGTMIMLDGIMQNKGLRK